LDGVIQGSMRFLQKLIEQARQDRKRKKASYT